MRFSHAIPAETSRLQRALFLCLLLSSVGLTGCSDSDDSTTSTGDATAGSGTASETGDSAATGDRRTIGFSALTLKNPFFKVIADTLTEEADKAGYDVIVTDANEDAPTQAKHIDNFIARQVSAIVINPADRVAMGPAIRKANEAGIPLFTCDLQCVADDIEIAGHVGTDNYQGGELAGQAMIEVLGESGGDVLVLHYKQANSCVLRVNGFNKVIDEHNKGREDGKITVVSELEGGGAQSPSFDATSACLQAQPNLKGIFAINDPSALGAWKALDEANKTDQVTIIGFDAALEGKEAIRDGKIYADPAQFPVRMAELTVQNIVAYMNAEEYEKEILIPAELYRKADAETDPELQGTAIK